MTGLSSKSQIAIAIFIILLIVAAILLAVFLPKNSDKDTPSKTTYSSIGKFNYELGPGVSPTYDEDIKQALQSWDQIILDDKQIDISFYTYSSNDSTLAFAYMDDEDDIYAGGVVYINTYNNPDSSMKNVIEHEIGHVLGIGTSSKWDMANDTGVLDKTLFPNAYAFYVDWIGEGTPNPNGIPLGAKGYHWSEEVFDTELMTPYSEAKGVELPTSGLTINALKDIGWNVDLSKADTFPPS